jgi:small subunit ribosomal protein S4
MKLYLKGAKCYTKKCPFERRPTPPGQHGVRRRKMSGFGVQLREKQKIRRVYSVHERQFKRYFDTAENRPGVTGENLLRLLETRLDNVVFRMGFSSSRAQARQLVNHGHFTVNGHMVNIPSFQVKEGDRVEVNATSRKTGHFKALADALRGAQRPDWLSVDPDKMTGSVTSLPRRDQMPLELNEQLVVEFYSR